MFELISLPMHLPSKIAIVLILMARIGEPQVVDHFARIEDISVHFLCD
jgi:hypothetical protein